MAHSKDRSPAKKSQASKRFTFPRWANYLLPLAFLGAIGAGLYVPTVMFTGFSPYATDVGYQPVQPVAYSHALHAGQLGIDCRYCHSTVGKAALAAVPPTQTCINCHTGVKPDSPKLQIVRESWVTGDPVKWTTVHDLPDYAYFNHSAHVNHGVGCVTCHGRIDQMETVYQAQPLSMGWCLDCHRAPEKYIRPLDQVTNLGWKVSDIEKTNPAIVEAIRMTHPGVTITQELLGNHLKQQYGIQNTAYMQSCSTCHR